MSCASSPSRTSSGEQTLYGANNDFVLPSDATEGTTHYDHTYYGAGSPLHQILAVNINAALDYGVNAAIVSGLEDALNEYNDETYSYANQSDDKDWLLFNNSNNDLPTVDYETDKFFEDADACVYSPAPAQAQSQAVAYAAPAEVEVETPAQEEEDIDLDDLSYDDTVHMHDIYESLNSFDIHSQPDYTPTEFEQPLQQESLLCHWAYDYQRHEWIATKFQQPPYTTVREPEQQQ